MAEFLSRRRYLAAAGGLAAAVATAGCSGGGASSTASPTPSLSVAELVFCADRPSGYDDYTEQPGPTYSIDETVWLYIDVRELGSESAGEETVVIDLTESLDVLGPDGESVLEDEIHFDNEFSADVDLQTFFVVNDVHLPRDAPAGDYTAEVSLTDALTGETATASGQFTAESSG